MRKLVVLLWVVVVLFGGRAVAAVGEDFNGTWFNPAQSGHGLTIEVVDHERAVALWYSYDPAGRPLTLYLDGRIDGRRIVATVFAPSGMRFGEFDPATLQLPAWGEVSIEFSSCEQALLRYAGALPEYGRGEFPLQRLVHAAPRSCDLDAGLTLPAGQYRGSHNEYGFVDDAGAFYGAYLYADAPWSQSLGASVPAFDVLFGQSAPRSQGRVQLSLQRYANNWLCHVRPAAGPGQCAVFAPEPRRFELVVRQEKVSGLAWPDAGDMGLARTLVGPDRSFLAAGPVAAGEYPFPVIGDDAERPSGRLVVDASQGLCVRVGDSDCLYRGQITPGTDPAAGFRFDLQRTDAAVAALRGQGWITLQPVVHTRVAVLSLFAVGAEAAMALRTEPTVWAGAP